MARCPRCMVGEIERWEEMYCEDCWDELEATDAEGHTADQSEASEETEDDMPDMQEPGKGPMS